MTDHLYVCDAIFQLDLAISDLTELEPLLLGSNAVKKMRFLLLEEKFLEFLAQNKTMDALVCLRTQLSPLKHNVERVHQLSSFLMMSPDNPELQIYRTNLTEARDILMERLQKFLPASVMLPPRRLRSLLAKVSSSVHSINELAIILQYTLCSRIPPHVSLSRLSTGPSLPGRAV